MMSLQGLYFLTMLWDSRDLSSAWERQIYAHLQKNKESFVNYILVSYCFCFQGAHRGIPSRSHFQVHKKQEGHMKQPHWIYQGKLCLTNLTAFSNKTGSVDDGKAEVIT